MILISDVYNHKTKKLMSRSFTPNDSSSSTNVFLDKINTEFETSFTVAACISKHLNCLDESHLAAKRVFSYNPNSKTILELFPQYTPIIEEISRLVDQHGQSLKVESNIHDRWSILGYCYLTLGDFPNSFAAYAHALRVSPDSRDTTFWYAMGIVYMHYKYLDHSLGCFEKVLEYDPSFIYASDIKFRLALLYRSMNRFNDAIQIFESIKQVPPHELLPEDITMQIAYTYQLQGNQDRALSIYRDLHQRFPRSLKLTQQYCWFMFLKYKDSNIELVDPIVREALNEDPHDPTLLLIAARVAMKKDDMSTAYQHYRYCISYCSDSPFFWCGLGVLYYKNEQFQDAVVAFQRALYLKSEMPEAWLNIGLIFEQQADFPSATKIYQTGLQKCPTCSEFNERLNLINAQRVGHRKGGIPYPLIDIDDSKFITPIPEQFAADYVAAVPKLPADCYGIPPEVASQFSALSTYPSSIFK
ncbi:TPR Domain containing protein [Tritrichomonas foetus]|uniref:TPR Domain containing protein n=1 Tax=Tritrichomonas foetus TaxID=1144522 RepID=A0A1J4JAZ1_9EUKA|nr:TPR Domain containing protein [Tritrichomonas foetus]|eukprot:OHS95399.1 TPR Domain containing protein [Tritrichomonas foetus]